MPTQRTKPQGLSNRFAHFAKASANAAGHPWAFILAILSMVLWVLLGPHYHYSNAWQLVVNSLTNIVTFLMVFVIQNSQNRESKALHLKLDEVIRALGQAHNEMIDIEKLSDKELTQLEQRYERIREEAQRRKLLDQDKPAA